MMTQTQMRYFSVDSSALKSRSIEMTYQGIPASDGAGVKLQRIIHQQFHKRLDPFLMLDNFVSDNPTDYIAGFPPHPHRGIETITYMLAGRMLHEDSMGNTGLLESGDVQWMTSGRGIIHSEMPQQTAGRMEGFQFWLNIPAKDKMNAPWYADFKQTDLPTYTTDNSVKVTVIAGESTLPTGEVVTGAVTRDITEPMMLDVHIPSGQDFGHSIEPNHNAFLFVYRGSVSVLGETVPEKTLAVLNNDAQATGVVLSASADAKVLLVSGKPLHEPIVAKGPMVMNSAEEIEQAFADYRNGVFA